MMRREVSGYEWVRVTDNAAYTPRDGAGALVFKGKMWLLGGWNPNDKENFPRICNNEVWSSDDGVSWHLEKSNSFHYAGATFNRTLDWEGRHFAGYVVYKEKMWIVGGDASQGHYHYDVWNTEDGKKWTCINDNVPWGPRLMHYTLVFKDKIWVMGGQTLPQFAPAENNFYDDIWCSSNGINWEEVTPLKSHWPARGMIGGNVVFKGRMWVLGGGTYDTPEFPERKFYNDVWSSSDGINWERHIESAPWKPRSFHEVAVFDHKMWVLEGNRWRFGGNQNDVWYSSDGVNWHELPDTPWSPRHAASVFVYDNALWMVAGNNMEKDVWKLQRRSDIDI